MYYIFIFDKIYNNSIFVKLTLFKDFLPLINKPLTQEILFINLHGLTYFKFNLTILTPFANINIEIGTTDKRLVQIHISYEK